MHSNAVHLLKDVIKDIIVVELRRNNNWKEEDIIWQWMVEFQDLIDLWRMETLSSKIYRKTSKRGAPKSLEHPISAVFKDMKMFSTKEIFYEYQAIFCQLAAF